MHLVPESGWFTSSYSQSEAACVEVVHFPAPFRKSSHSGARGECVEADYAPTSFRGSPCNATESHRAKIADRTAHAAIRDSKHQALDTLVFSAFEWQAFLEAVKKLSP